MALETPGVREDTGHEPASLSERVRSLRLPDQPRQAARRGSWIPWMLCLLLGVSTGVLAYQVWNRSESVDTAGNGGGNGRSGGESKDGGGGWRSFFGGGQAAND